MARYLRVRATRPQGAHRAGMFFGTEAQALDKNTLTPDQINLLKAEDGRMLIVDETDDPNAFAAGATEAEVFDAHPEILDRVTAAEAERDAARQEVEAVKATAKAQAEQAADAAKSDVERAIAEADAARAEADAARAEAAEVHAELEALQARVASEKARAAKAKAAKSAGTSKADPKVAE